MEKSHKLRKTVLKNIDLLLKCGNLDIIHGVALASLYNTSMWAEEVNPPADIHISIDYAETKVNGLIQILSNINLTPWS